MSVCSNDLDEDEKIVLNWSRQNTAFGREMERTIKNQFDAVVHELDRYVMATRQRREPYRMFYDAMRLPSINQSNFSLFSSRSTLTDVQSIAAQSEVSSATVGRTSARFTERLKQATKQPSATTYKTTTNKNTPKMVFIPSGFERDVLEFHKYNDL